MTVKELMEMGYEKADIKYARGYVSRKQDELNAEVHEAGGSRKGEYYALLPCFTSSQYCFRQYYKKGE